jgi:hypothetical protein
MENRYSLWAFRVTLAALIGAHLADNPHLFAAALLVGLLAVRLRFPADWRLLRVSWLVGWVLACILFITEHYIWMPAATLAAIVAGYALLYRFSTLSLWWAAGSLAVTVTLWTPGLILTGLSTIVPPSRPHVIMGGLWLAAHGLYLAHSHLALINPAGGRTYAAYWFALGIILLFLGQGIVVLGVMLTPATSQNSLWPLYGHLTTWGVAAMILGTFNHETAIIRGNIKQHVMGLLPFWTISIGVITGAGILAAQAIGQIALYNVGIYEQLIIPAYAHSRSVVLIGLLIYAVGFGLRANLPRGT